MLFGPTLCLLFRAADKLPAPGDAEGDGLEQTGSVKRRGRLARAPSRERNHVRLLLIPVESSKWALCVGPAAHRSTEDSGVCHGSWRQQGQKRHE